jgi:hypothetical protein
VKITEAALEIGITEGRIRQMIGKGEFRAERRGRGYCVSPAEVERQKDLRRDGRIKVGRESAIDEPKDELATFTNSEVGVKSTELLDLLLVLHKFGWQYSGEITFDVSAQKGVDIKAEVTRFIREARLGQDVVFCEATLFVPQRQLSHSLPLIEKRQKRNGKSRGMDDKQLNFGI